MVCIQSGTGLVTDLVGEINAVQPAVFGYFSADPTETYTTFDVSTPISSLRATGTNQFAIFNDLGTGTSYGAVTVSAADNGSFVVVNLNAAGIAYLNNNLGGDVAIAGAITTLDRSEPNEQGLFRFTPGTPIPGNTKLEVTIPEPLSIGVIAHIGLLLSLRTSRLRGRSLV